MSASSRTVVRNGAHFFDHYAMLIIVTAAIPMAAAMGYGYSQLLSYATPGFIAFGAGSLAAGWLGDALERGMIARAMPHGDILGFAPPLVLTRAEADEIVAIAREAVDAVAECILE